MNASQQNSFFTTAIVPKSNGWIVTVVVIWDDAQRNRAEKKESVRRGFQSQPARDKDVQKVTVREYQAIAGEDADSLVAEIQAAMSCTKIFTEEGHASGHLLNNKTIF